MDIQENHKEHVLKTDHVVFQDVLDGNKTFEIRFNDRDYQVGDLVILKETEFTGEQMKSGQPLVYTGREMQKRISYVLSGYGLHEGWVILGIQDIKVIKAQAVPEGFVLVPKENISCYWQDNDEPENFCSNESDFDCLGDCIDLGEIMEINKFTQAHVNKEILFGTWFAEAIDPSEKANFFVGTHAECLEIVAKNKAMIEAQGQK